VLVVEINNNRLPPKNQLWARGSRVNLSEGMLEGAEIIFSVLFSEKSHARHAALLRAAAAVSANPARFSAICKATFLKVLR